MIYLSQILTNPYHCQKEESFSVSVWPEISYLAKLISDNFWSIDGGHNPRHAILERPNMPSLSASIIIYSYAGDYKNWKQNVHSHRIRMRENGGSINFNFISLLNSVVDESWVYRHRLLQFTFWKWCHVQKLQCPNLFRFLENSKFTERFHFFVHG